MRYCFLPTHSQRSLTTTFVFSAVLMFVDSPAFSAGKHPCHKVILAPGESEKIVQQKKALMVDGLRFRNIRDAVNGEQGVNQSTLDSLKELLAKDDVGEDALCLVLQKDPFLTSLVENRIIPSTTVGSISNWFLDTREELTEEDFIKTVDLEAARLHASNIIAKRIFDALEVDQLKFQFLRHDTEVVYETLILDLFRPVQDLLQSQPSRLALAFRFANIPVVRILSERLGLRFGHIYQAIHRAGQTNLTANTVVGAFADLISDPREFKDDPQGLDAKAAMYIAFEKQDTAILDGYFSNLPLSQVELFDLIRYLDSINKRASLRYIVHNLDLNQYPDKGGELLTLLAVLPTVAGDLHILRDLVKRGVNVNYTDCEGVTPLVAAVLSKMATTAAVLIELGAKVSNPITNRETGETLAHQVMRSNIGVIDGTKNTSLVEVLARAGLYWDVVDHEGNTPAHIAVLNKNIEHLETIHRYGASVTDRNHARISPRDIIVSENVPYFLERFDSLLSGVTSEHFIRAAALNDVAGLDAMIARGFSLNVRDVENRLPIERAIEHGTDAFVVALIERGASTHRNPILIQREPTLKQDTRTILHLLAEKGFTESYKMLLTKPDQSSLVFNTFFGIPEQTVSPIQILRQNGFLDLATFTEGFLKTVKVSKFLTP